jgi:hypothetical protein
MEAVCSLTCLFVALSLLGKAARTHPLRWFLECWS